MWLLSYNSAHSPDVNNTYELWQLQQVVAVELLHWHGKLGGTLEKLGVKG